MFWGQTKLGAGVNILDIIRFVLYYLLGTLFKSVFQLGNCMSLILLLDKTEGCVGLDYAAGSLNCIELMTLKES